jgi:hypothetical protein
MFDLVKFDVSPRGGDSGGPVFRFFEGYAYAAGIQSGRNSAGTKGYFVKWTNLPASWNIVLKVYTPPCPCPI